MRNDSKRPSISINGVPCRVAFTPAEIRRAMPVRRDDGTTIGLTGKFKADGPKPRRAPKTLLREILEKYGGHIDSQLRAQAWEAAR